MTDKFQKTFKVFKKHYNGVPLEIFTTPYEVLISTMLSSRTNDDTTLPAAKRDKVFRTSGVYRYYK